MLAGSAFRQPCEAFRRTPIGRVAAGLALEERERERLEAILEAAMEGSQSEAVFDSHHLNPQLFINEVLNMVDDLVDDAFGFCQQQAYTIVGGDAGTDRSEELRRGISSLHLVVQGTLNKRLNLWERYCLLHCFTVPEGFLPDNTSLSGDDLLLQDGLKDAELDYQLVSLRKKLAMVGNESAALQREICLLEKQSLLHSGYHASISEMLHQLEENSVHRLFQEVEESTSKLYREMEILQRQPIPTRTVGNALGQTGAQWVNNHGPSTKLEDLEKATDILKLFRKP